MTMICMELQSAASLEGDDIYREGEWGDCMYFVRKGSVLLTTTRSPTAAAPTLLMMCELGDMHGKRNARLAEERRLNAFEKRER